MKTFFSTDAPSTFSTAVMIDAAGAQPGIFCRSNIDLTGAGVLA